MCFYKNTFLIPFYLLMAISLSSCSGFKPGDARKNPPEPEKRVAKNLEEGRGFRLNDTMKKVARGTGSFEFASSNELWRASLDAIDFMPLASANYSGGVIITDWYSENDQNESIKITIRFLSNEIRSDSLDINIFLKNCKDLMNCKTIQTEGQIASELRKKILKKAAFYKETSSNKKKKKKYIYNDPKN